jgi:YidC/Oxa1 family membrane protein insertase
MFTTQPQKRTPWQLIRRYLIWALVLLELMLVFGGFDKHGRTWLWIGQYLAKFMTWMADNLFTGANGVGFAVIALTAIIRLILMPIMLDQSIKATTQSEKMGMLKPQLDKLQAAQKSAASREEAAALSQMTMRLYSEHDLSLFGGINMLSMLIQLPIFSGLYTAIHLSNLTKDATFFGIDLAKPSLVITIVAGLLYFAQSYFQLMNTPEEQRKQMRTMIWLSPAMIVFFSFSQSSALGLYFVVGGVFVLVQTIIVTILRPRLKAKARENFEVKDIVDDLIQDAKDNPFAGMPNAAAMQAKQSPKDVTPKNTATGNRNAGKQKGRK